MQMFGVPCFVSCAWRQRVLVPKLKDSEGLTHHGQRAAWPAASRGVAKPHAAHSYSLWSPPSTRRRTTLAERPGFCCGGLPRGESSSSVRCGRVTL